MSKIYLTIPSDRILILKEIGYEKGQAESTYGLLNISVSGNNYPLVFEGKKFTFGKHTYYSKTFTELITKTKFNLVPNNKDTQSSTIEASDLRTFSGSLRCEGSYCRYDIASKELINLISSEDSVGYFFGLLTKNSNLDLYVSSVDAEFNKAKNLHRKQQDMHLSIGNVKREISRKLKANKNGY